MKRNCFLVFVIMLILLISACSSKTNQAKIQSEATQNKAVTVETPPSQKKEYHTQIAIIGMNQQALETATSALEYGCQSVLILANGQPIPSDIIATHPELTFVTEGVAQGILMTFDGAIRGINGFQEGNAMTIHCNTVILAHNPQRTEVASLVAFLSHDEKGNLHADNKGQLLRQITASQGVPTKCGVPLTVAGSEKELPPEVTPVAGFYALSSALGTDAQTIPPQELGKLVAAKEKMSGLQLISLNN
ncbi:MAG: hypothetical protein J6R67_02350 [Treponema sp.]|nr:hypothetical protein [Treponema sp.]